MSSPFTFNPLFLHPTSTPNPYILILLNQPITNIPLFIHLWQHATLRVAADGASNHIYDVSVSTNTPYTPDVILGDLDSIKSDTRAFYSARNVPIEHFPSQDATDFTKCLTWAFSHLPNHILAGKGKIDVIALNSLGGRLDASFHSLHQLFLFSSGVFPCPPAAKAMRGILWLVSPPNLTFLLPAGHSRIDLSGAPASNPTIGDDITEVSDLKIKRKEVVFGRAICGILPLTGERMIRTKGLRWDTEWVQGVGVVEGYGLSTSNEVVGTDVEVMSEGGGVAFTVELGGVWDRGQ